MKLSFRKAHELTVLHDELLAAGISPTRVEGDGTNLVLVVDDAVAEADVQAVVDAHNRAQGQRRSALRDLRHERNRLLSLTDWTQLDDAPAEPKEVWASYRQALRDLPAATSDPRNVTWPEPPAPLEPASPSL